MLKLKEKDWTSIAWLEGLAGERTWQHGSGLQSCNWTNNKTLEQFSFERWGQSRDVCPSHTTSRFNSTYQHKYLLPAVRHGGRVFFSHRIWAACSLSQPWSPTAKAWLKYNRTMISSNLNQCPSQNPDLMHSSLKAPKASVKQHCKAE